MNETLKQFTADLATALKARLESPELKEFIEKTKASADDRTFEVVMSTSDEDRQGDALDQSKWDLKYYSLNPVVLWAHNYQDFPIGIVTDIKTDGNKTITTGKFAPAGLNPTADIACGLYQAGILKAVSPGYIQNDDGTRELLEQSFCPVPAGRYALSMRQVQSLGVSTRELVTKGFFTETKAAQVGDRCEMDDGTPGVLADDEDNPGTLVCVPPEGKSNETQQDMNNELTKNLKAEHERHGQEVANAIVDYEGKSIEEFRKAVNSENETHFDKCMKAINEGYMLSDGTKSIADFKSAVINENYKHGEEVNKAINEFDKNIDEFTSTIKAELGRHQDAHMDLCKAEFGEGQDDGKSKSADEPAPEPAPVAEPVVPEPVVPEPEIPAPEQKSGRTISAASKEKIKAVIKAMEDHHTDHGKSTDNVIAALKDLMGPEGSEGEEQHGKTAAAPKPKVEVRDIPATEGTFEAFMVNRRVLRTVDNAIGKALEDLNTQFRKTFPSRR